MQKKFWIYDGGPQYVNLKLPAISSTLGIGHILFLFLNDGSVWLFASRNPGKCVSSWSNTARRYDLHEINHVLVSQPLLFYTSVKKKIEKNIEGYRMEKSGGYIIDREILVSEAENVFAMAAKPMPDSHG